MHQAVDIGQNLGAPAKSIAEIELAATDGKAYVAKFATRLAERNITKPTKQLPWIALVDALVTAKLAVELDHRTYPEDVIDALDTLKSLPKSKSRWRWANDVDEGTSTTEFLAAAVHHAKLPLATIDLGSDSIVVVATKDAAKLGLKPIAPKALSATKPVAAPANDATAIAAEDAKPHEEFRYVIAGEKRGDDVFGVVYDEPYLNYRFYRELRGRVGFAKSEIATKSGFSSRDAAVAAAERELEQRISDGWQRVSRARLRTLPAKAAKK